VKDLNWVLYSDFLGISLFLLGMNLGGSKRTVCLLVTFGPQKCLFCLISLSNSTPSPAQKFTFEGSEVAITCSPSSDTEVPLEHPLMLMVSSETGSAGGEGATGGSGAGEIHGRKFSLYSDCRLCRLGGPADRDRGKDDLRGDVTSMGCSIGSWYFGDGSRGCGGGDGCAGACDTFGGGLSGVRTTGKKT